MLPPDPWPCCANAVSEKTTTASVSSHACAYFMKVTSLRFPIAAMLRRDLVTATPACQVSDVDAYTEGNRIQIVVNTACVSQLQIKVRRGVGIDPGREAVIACQVGAARSLLIVLEHVTVTARTAMYHLAEDGLLA